MAAGGTSAAAMGALRHNTGCALTARTKIDRGCMKAHVLLVDDDRHITDVLRRALAYEGYGVEVALRGDEALRKALEHPPDLVVLDLMLPGIDGLEVCRRLRASGNQVPILMLTAKDSIPDRVAGLDQGADDYLVKPMELEEDRKSTRLNSSHVEISYAVFCLKKKKKKKKKRKEEQITTDNNTTRERDY